MREYTGRSPVSNSGFAMKRRAVSAASFTLASAAPLMQARPPPRRRPPRRVVTRVRRGSTQVEARGSTQVGACAKRSPRQRIPRRVVKRPCARHDRRLRRPVHVVDGRVEQQAPGAFRERRTEDLAADADRLQARALIEARRLRDEVEHRRHGGDVRGRCRRIAATISTLSIRCVPPSTVAPIVSGASSSCMEGSKHGLMLCSQRSSSRKPR